MKVTLRLLGPGDSEVLEHVAPGVFDFPIRPELAQEFLADPRHHIAVAIEDDVVVGFASGVHYIHPDKPAELFVNEVGVAPTHRKRGIGTHVVECLLNHARSLGCKESWVLTEDTNDAAVRLYEKAGGRHQEPSSRLYSFKLAD